MTPHEKAVNAINARLERLQANLRAAKVEASQRFLVQSLVVTIGVGEALNDYIRTVGRYAERRHAEVKRTNEALAAQHADSLRSGQELLDKLKANPSDRAVRHEIELVQQKMAAVQKTLQRTANALQRELSPGVAMIDALAVSVRRFSEADQGDELKRVLETMVEQVVEFYASLRTVTKGLLDGRAWRDSAVAEIDGASDFYDAYARAGYQAAVALESMTLALSEDPPRNAAETTRRANEAVAERIKAVTARFSMA